MRLLVEDFRSFEVGFWKEFHFRLDNRYSASLKLEGTTPQSKALSGPSVSEPESDVVS